MKHRGMRATVALSALSVLALLAAACGDDSGGSDAATTGGAATTAASATTAAGAATTAASDTTSPSGEANAVPTETGPADDSLDPIGIGFMNIDDGPVAFPATTKGAEAAVKYINEKLGGIDGHPVELKPCAVGFDDASIQKCAQEFANDDSVGIVATGFVINAGGPQYPIFQSVNLPVSIQVPLQAPDLSTPIGFAPFPGNPGISAGLPFFLAKFLGAKSIAVIVSDNDAGRGAIQLVQQVPFLTENNIEIKPVFVKDNEVDYTGPIKAAGADTADAFLPLVAQQGCIQVANAMATLGLTVPTASTGLCADPSVTEAVGGKTDGWYIGFAGTPAFVGPGIDPEVDFYLETYPTVGDPADMFGAGASQSWGQMLALWTIGNEIGGDNISREAWLDGITGFTGPVLLGPRAVKCPGTPFPSVCTSQSRVFQMEAGGTQFTDATDGEYIDPFGA